LYHRLIYIRRSRKPVNFEQLLVDISILLMVVSVAHALNIFLPIINKLYMI
jgi:hypothetical protein